MTRADDIQALAALIRRDLRDGQWHRAVGLGGWGHSPGLVGDALNLLLQAEVIEYDARRRVYRLVPTRTRQTTIYDQEAQ